MILSPDILIALATLVVCFSAASSLSSWSDGVFPKIELGAMAGAVGVFVYAYTLIDDPQGWREIPNAFISLFALIIR